MSQPVRPRGLGRGLSSLLGDEEVAAAVVSPFETVSSDPASSQWASSQGGRPAGVSRRPPSTLPIDQLRPGEHQPRTLFEGIDDLVASVREYGLLQPILVRPHADAADVYEIIAGERRWRAAQKAQLHEVPVVIRHFSHLEALQIALVENLQRVDLSPIDEAAGYRRLIDQFDQTQEAVASTVGKSRPHVANLLRLLELPKSVQDKIADRRLSAGQARALLGFADPEAMAERAIAEKLTVRDLESMAKRLDRAPAGTVPGPTRTPARGPGGGKTADTLALENRIEDALGLKADLVKIGTGEEMRLSLSILDYDQLDTVVERLTRR